MRRVTANDRDFLSLLVRRLDIKMYYGKQNPDMAYHL